MEDIPQLQKEYHISSIKGRVEEIQFNTPVHLPFGEIHTRPSLLVEAIVSDGTFESRGVAEGASLPMQIPMYDDCSDNLLDNATVIAEQLQGVDMSLRKVQDAISAVALGGNFATARMTVESSIIDAVARLEGSSVYSLLTGTEGPVRVLVPYGKSITEIDGELMTVACHTAIDAGARRLKFKISPNSFDQVYPTLKRLIDENPDSTFMVDANGMFDPLNDSHNDMLRALDQLGMLTIEEPVSRAGSVRGLDAHRILRDKLSFATPITIDDAIKTDNDAEMALTENLADIVNLKPGRVGSFLRCIDIAHNAAAKNKQIMVGGMFEATPGRFMTTTLAAYCINLGFTIPGDLSLPNERLAHDIGDDRLSLDSDGNIIFQPKEGWGYAIESL